MTHKINLIRPFKGISKPPCRFFYQFIFLLFGGFLFMAQSGLAQPCDFSFSNTTGAPCTYQFTSNVNEVDGYLIKHFWDFGDGSTSDVANPKHSYPSTSTGGGNASYTVIHTVTICDPFTLAVVNTFTCHNNVTVGDAGTVGGCQLCPKLVESGPIFDYHVTGCTVEFQAHIPLGFYAIWNFGDGTNGVFPQNYTHTYAHDGVYTVSVSTINTQNPNEVYRCQRTITVDCSRPCCDFTWELDEGCCFALKMDVEGCNMPNASYAWFVDGVFVDNGPNPNLFPNGVNICDIQQNGGIMKVSLVTQLDGESCIISKGVDLSAVSNPGIYIGSGKLSDFENLLPGNTYCGTCPVHVCGLVEVDKDFEFCGAEVIVAPGMKGFDVDPGITFTLSNATHMYGCDCLYRGILALPGSTVNVNSGSTIEDAGYAVWGQEGSVLNFNAANFLNNYVGIRIDGNANLHEFTQNFFSTNRVLYDDCENILAGLGYTTALGYAGMRIDHDGNTMDILDDGNQNIFDNLAIGIYSTDGTINLQPCCTFQNMTNCAVYQGGGPEAVGGRGIWFDDDDSFTSTGNVFDNVSTGILGTTAKTTDINVDGNNMLSVSRGVDLHTESGGNMIGDVSNNTITVDINPCIVTAPGFAYGIGFEDNTTQVNDVLITSNPITVTYPSSPGFSAYGIFLLQTNPANNAQVEVEVDNNDNINLINGYAGIEMRTFIRGSVHGNTVNVTGTGNGILATGGRNNFICSNSINGGGFGLKITGSATGIIQSNIMTNTFTGAFFGGNCGFDTRFGCNTFAGSQSIGLQYEFNAQVGVQTEWDINAGNEWTGAFSFARALISVGPNLPGNIFFVPLGHPTLDPGNTQMFAGQPWFVAEDFYPPGNCTVNTCSGFGRPAGKREDVADYPNILLPQLGVPLQITPNPNAGEFIATFGTVPDGAATLQVISISGALIRTYQIPQGETLYRISGMEPGVYFLRLMSEGKNISEPVKMIVF